MPSDGTFSYSDILCVGTTINIIIVGNVTVTVIIISHSIIMVCTATHLRRIFINSSTVVIVIVIVNIIVIGAHGSDRAHHIASCAGTQTFQQRGFNAKT